MLTLGRRKTKKLAQRRFSAAGEYLEPRVVLAASPLITEFMAVNNRTLTDADGNASDWIELYNPTDGELSLDGWYLTDDATTPTKWRFPAVNIPANGYKVVFASGENRTDASAELHTSFKLSGDGEFLALVEPDGATISQQFAPTYPPQRADVAYGLSADLSTLAFFDSPTPGAENSEGAVAIVDAVGFSVERGFFDSPFSLEITTTTPGAAIRYTLDGSLPTSQRGTIYSQPIPIDSTSTLRAAAFKEGYVDGQVSTQTYLFVADVLSQTRPEGYPLLLAGDYNVLPAIVEEHRDTLVDDLKAIPSLSLVMNVDAMFGSDGLNTDGSDDSPTSVEMIFPDGRVGFQIDAGVRQQGGATRLPTVPKHAFRLKFTSEFGPSKLEFPLFEDSPVTRFDTVVLRANFQDGWQRGSVSQNQQIKDEFARRTQLDMGQPSARGRFVHLYLNGLYWGMYNLTERPDASFASENLGGAREDWDAFNAGRVRDGNTDAWDAMLALTPKGGSDIRNNFDAATVAANYEAIQEFLDIPAFIDYILLGTFIGTQDWLPNNNYEARRSRDGDGPVDPADPNSRFRFFHWDQEDSLLGLDRFKNLPGFNSPAGRIFQLLRLSAEFREMNGQRIFDHFKSGAALSPEANIERYQGLVDEVKDAIKGEAIRWGAGPRTFAQWRSDAEQLVTSYFPNRAEGIIEQYRRFRLYPAIDPPTFSQRGGPIQPTDRVEITAQEGDIFFTLDGSDPKLSDGSLSPSALPYTDAITLNKDTVVRVRARSGQVWSVRNEAAFEVATDPVVQGDFDNSGVVDAKDIDLLCQEIRSGQSDPRFDLTGDDLVDRNDYQLMINDVVGTRLGDANLDGKFDSQDLIVLLQAGQYEDQVAKNASWATGDFDCDGEFGTSDLVLIFQRGGFSQ